MGVDTGGFPDILPYRSHTEPVDGHLPIDVGVMKLRGFKFVESHPCPIRMRCANSGVGTLPIQIQCVEKCKGTKEGENELRNSQFDNLPGRISHTLLRNKIVFFTVSGFLLQPLGVLGLFWFFEYSDRNTRRSGAILAGVVLPISFGLVLFGLLG